jgi:cytochrome c oxidase subunit 1
MGVGVHRGLARAQFWVMFVGVNLTFFPMHFLGLNGIPRRYRDYPEVFRGWNYLASVGRVVSLVGVVLFGLMVLERVVVQRKCRFHFIEGSCEWGFEMPPQGHTLHELSLFGG